jgi:N-acetyl-anhydromuramyl-L-alanine amidase AmpD
MKLKTLNKVVIHHSASEDGTEPNIEQIREWHKAKGWADIGYHYVIERVHGKLQMLSGRPANLVGAHAKGANSDSIGVCLVGNFSIKPPDDALLDFAAAHVAGLVWWKYNLFTLKPHREVGSTKTDCPGKLFPWEKFVNMVDKNLK